MPNNDQEENNFVENATNAVVDSVQSIANAAVNTAQNVVGMTIDATKNVVNAVTGNNDADNE